MSYACWCIGCNQPCSPEELGPLMLCANCHLEYWHKRKNQARFDMSVWRINRALQCITNWLFGGALSQLVVWSVVWWSSLRDVPRYMIPLHWSVELAFVLTMMSAATLGVTIMITSIHYWWRLRRTKADALNMARTGLPTLEEANRKVQDEISKRPWDFV